MSIGKIFIFLVTDYILPFATSTAHNMVQFIMFEKLKVMFMAGGINNIWIFIKNTE